MIYEKVDVTRQNNLLKAFYFAFFSTIVAAFFSISFFPGVYEMGASALISISIAHLMQNFLEHNRHLIWESKESPLRANALLAKQITTIFLGIFFASTLLNVYFAQSMNIEEVYKNTFTPLLFHNFQILIAGTIFALFYRSGGLVVILAWNALHWSKAIGTFAVQISASAGLAKAGIVVLSIMPHLLLEVIAYVIAGMSGVFLSKALTKYKPSSYEFYRVSAACLVLILVSFAILALSVTCEIYLAQKVFHSQVINGQVTTG